MAWRNETRSDRCHVNWVILDSDWEGEFCRVAESHPQVRAYAKNHGLGLEIPYRYGSQARKYLPDFIVDVEDGHGEDDLLHLIVEIKGYRREDAARVQTLSEQQVAVDVAAAYYRVVSQQALTIAFDDVFRVMCWIFVAALLMVPFARPSSGSSRAAAPVEAH